MKIAYHSFETLRLLVGILIISIAVGVTAPFILSLWRPFEASNFPAKIWLPQRAKLLNAPGLIDTDSIAYTSQKVIGLSSREAFEMRAALASATDVMVIRSLRDAKVGQPISDWVADVRYACTVGDTTYTYGDSAHFPYVSWLVQGKRGESIELLQPDTVAMRMEPHDEGSLVVASVFWGVVAFATAASLIAVWMSWTQKTAERLHRRATQTAAA